MGDKGGKKDKEKNKQQQIKKQKQEEQKKLSRAFQRAHTCASQPVRIRLVSAEEYDA